MQIAASNATIGIAKSSTRTALFGLFCPYSPIMADSSPQTDHPIVTRFIEDSDSEAEAAKYFQNRLIQLLSQGTSFVIL